MLLWCSSQNWWISLSTPLMQHSTELDTLQRVTKCSSTRSQKEGQLMILWDVTLGKTLPLLKGHCLRKNNNILYSGLRVWEKIRQQANSPDWTNEDKSSTTFGEPVGAEWNPPANSYGCTIWHGCNSDNNVSAAWFASLIASCCKCALNRGI